MATQKRPKAGQRPSNHITCTVTQSCFRAFDFAAALGKPLNTYIVINIKETASLGAATAFTSIRHKFRDWLTNKNKTSSERHVPIYIYVLENPGSVIHVNWAVHVPPSMMAEFKAKISEWVKKVIGELRPFDVKIKRIKQNTTKTLAKYVVKGTDPKYGAHFYLEKVISDQGEVWGKRAGISQAIGIKARQRAGFRPGRRHHLYPQRQSKAVMSPAASRTFNKSANTTSGGPLDDLLGRSSA